MADARLEKLIERLYEQTVDGKLKWEKTADKTTFQVSFPTYSVRVFAKYAAPESVYGLAIHDKDGDVVESVDTDFTDYSLMDEAPRLPTAVVNTLAALYADARRIALNVDHVLDSLLEALAKR